MYGKDWKSTLELIKAQRAEFQQYNSIMTDYERSIAQREMEETLQTWKGRIVEALINEQNTAISEYQYAEKRLERAHQAEVNRWDASRLRAEMDVAQALVNQARSGKHTANMYDGGSPSTYKRIEAVYQDAQKSGDIFKKRAICEVIQGVDIGEGEIMMNRLRKQAERDLSELRRIPEQAEAEEHKEAAWRDVLVKTNDIIVAAPHIGEEATGAYAAGWSLGRAVNRIKIRKDGTREILDPQSSEVTGVYMRASKPVEGENA